MPPPRLEIGPIKNIQDLETCLPNLMPFHIDYSGQAPISTYLLVEAANEDVGAPPSTEGENKPPSGDTKPEGSSKDLPGPSSTSTSTSTSTDNTETDTKPPATAPTSPAPSIGKRITDATTRFVSSFRGRTIHGLKVDLPSGYAGVVLRAEGTVGRPNARDDVEERMDKGGKGKGKGKGKATGTRTKGRATRSATRVIDVDEEGGDGMDVDALDVLGGGLPDDTATRTLAPSAQFSSFVLWHPDIPVDEGRDEYFRSLTEWVRLADEIHRVEE